MRNWCFWVVGLSCQGSSTVSCYPGSVLMRMLSPFSNALNEDNAASNHEDLLIPANLAAAEEAAVSKVSPPAGLEGFCVTLWATDASRQAQQTLLHASHNSVNTSGWWMPKSAFWSRQGHCTDLSKGHFWVPFQVLCLTLMFLIVFLMLVGSPLYPSDLMLQEKRLQGWNSDTGNSYQSNHREKSLKLKCLIVVFWLP